MLHEQKEGVLTLVTEACSVLLSVIVVCAKYIARDRVRTVYFQCLTCRGKTSLALLSLPPSLPVTFTWFRSRGIVTFVMSGRRDTAAAWRWSQLVCACIECRCACRVCFTCLKSTRKGQWHRQYVNYIEDTLYACGRMCRKRFIALM